MQTVSSMKAEQASCNSLSAGKIFEMRNCFVRASSRWPSDASWSLADFGPRFINLTGLYLEGLYQRSELSPVLLSDSWDAIAVAQRKVPSATIAKARLKPRMSLLPLCS